LANDAMSWRWRWRRRWHASSTSIAYWLSPNATVRLVPVGPPCDVATTIPQQLVIQPGTVCFGHVRFNLQRSGLYRFFESSATGSSGTHAAAAQRLVFGGHRRDVAALLSGVAWVATHGNRHNGLTMAELERLALTEKLTINCGVITNFALHILMKHSAHIPRLHFRPVQLWAEPRAATGQREGHTLLEISGVYSSPETTERHWALVDLDQKVRPYDPSTGGPLNLTQFRTRLQRSWRDPAVASYALQALAVDLPIDVAIDLDRSMAARDARTGRLLDFSSLAQRHVLELAGREGYASTSRALWLDQGDPSVLYGRVAGWLAALSARRDLSFEDQVVSAGGYRKYFGDESTVGELQ
jgi:hypothetical protein